MRIAIVGLPGSGKTTVFNAVTRGTAQVASYACPQGKPNLGVAKVPDHRLDALEGVFKAKRKVPAEVTYVDIPPGPGEPGKTHVLPTEFLNALQGTDALLIVARTFGDPSVSHVEGTIDPFRDIETMRLELSIADLEILERRLARLAESSKGAKAPQRDALAKELALLERLKAGLESGTALRDQSFTLDEARTLEGFQFLTGKPIIAVMNVGENQMSEATSLEERLSSAVERPRIITAVLCGKLEMDLAQMEPAEEREFREGLGASESSVDRMARLALEVGDLITFFTGNANEVKAWTVPRDATAVRAAGKVHSDFERGFIRAEVVRSEDLADSGSMAEARKRGLLRQEGKAYVVRDGDVLNILFSV